MNEIIITIEQCKGGRAMLDLSRKQLANLANISERTLVDFERGARVPYENNLRAIKQALETAGVEFLPENGGGAGVRLKK